jgi:hypothetical protein
MHSTFQIIAHLHKLNSMDSDTLFFCLEAVADIETETASRSCQKFRTISF